MFIYTIFIKYLYLLKEKRVYKKSQVLGHIFLYIFIYNKLLFNFKGHKVEGITVKNNSKPNTNSFEPKLTSTAGTNSFNLYKIIIK